MPVNFKIGKVNAGRVVTRGKHNLNHDVTTSMSFGKVTPLLCKAMTPHSSLKGKIDTQVRVMPLPLPPHGQIKLHTYGQFVPMRDIYRPFAEWLSQKPFASANKQYIPSELPAMYMSPEPMVGVYNDSSGTMIPTFKNINTTFNLLGMVFGKTGCFWGVKKVSSVDFNTSSSTQSAINFSYKDSDWMTDDTSGKVSYSSSSVSTSTVNALCGFAYIQKYNGSSSASKGDSDAKVPALLPEREWSDELDSTEPFKPSKFNEVFHGLPETGRVLNDSEAKECGLTIENADYRFLIPIIDGTYDVTYSMIRQMQSGDVMITNTNNQFAVVFVRLSQQGKEILKALQVMGYSMPANIGDPIANNPTPDPVSILPIMAYYKAWFDIFYPQRNITWRSTFIFKLLDWIAENDTLPQKFFGNWVASGVNWGYSKLPTIQVNWLRYIFDDIANLCATSDPNYFSVAITNFDESSVSEPAGGSLTQEDLVFDESSANAGVSGQSGIVTTNRNWLSVLTGGNAPRYENNNDNSITWNALRLLRSLTKYVNTNTVIGQSVEKYINAHFGGSAGESFTSNFAGSSVTEIQLGDVIQTATTDKANAGDFAGVGYGKGGFKIKYNTKEAGYYFVLAVIKPVCNYVQGDEWDLRVIKPLQYPTPEFDAIGYDDIKVNELFTNRTGGTGIKASSSSVWFNNYSSIFGYVPRYTGHKVKKSVLAGDFALPSVRDTYLGFTLDHYISQDVVKTGGNDTTKTMSVINPTPSMFSAGTQWRWLTKYPWLDNFDRIFYDASPTSALNSRQVFSGSGSAPRQDDFLVFNHVDLTLNDNLKSISQSFDTLEGADNYVEHQ